MILDLEEFGEEDSMELHFEPSRSDVEELLEATEYRPTSGLVVDFHANREGTTIVLRGTIEGSLSYQCGRCLETRDVALDGDAEFVLMPHPKWVAEYEGEDEIELAEEDLDVSYYDALEVDLEPLVREAILLELPVFPVCEEEDREACDEAYRRNVGEETLEDNEENSMDLRWAPLKDIELED